jgi:hypothetical protein
MMQHLIDREMSITHDEFFRLLPKALKTRRYEILNNVVYVTLGHGSITITLSPQTSRGIGSLVLPVTHVNFAVINCPDEISRMFFDEFDIAFQKGGG